MQLASSSVRGFDRHQYKHRDLMERFFCRIKQFCRIATRYDELTSRLLSLMALTSFIWFT